MRLYRQISGSERSSSLSDELAAELTERFDSAMGDDLNTPEVIAALFEDAGRAGREVSGRPEAADEFASLAEAVEEIMTVFGFDLAEERALELGVGSLCHFGCLGEHLVVAGLPRGVGARLAVLEDADAAGGDNAALGLGDKRDR